MKSLLIASALCFLAVSGFPDQDLRLENFIDSKPVLEPSENEAIATTPAPEAKVKTSNQGLEPDRTRLMADLFTNYNKRVNPDNVTLNFGINLIDFRVRESNNAIESYIWLRYQWVDTRLAWKPEDYGGVEVLRIESNAVWKPDVTLYNSVDPVNMVNCWPTNIIVFPTGKIIFVPPCKMTSQCELKLRKYPYGEQECIMKFGSWTFDGNVLDIQFYGGKSEIDTSQMHNSSGFEVLSTTGERNVKHYPCCSEPYPDLTFNMTIRRLPAEELFTKLQ